MCYSIAIVVMVVAWRDKVGISIVKEVAPENIIMHLTYRGGSRPLLTSRPCISPH